MISLGEIRRAIEVRQGREDQRKRPTRNIVLAIGLGALALAIYLTFILLHTYRG